MPSLKLLQKSTVILYGPPFLGEVAVAVGDVADDGTLTVVYKPGDVKLPTSLGNSDLRMLFRGNCLAAGELAIARRKEPDSNEVFPTGERC